MTTDTTTGTILLRNTMAFERRHAAEFKQAIRRAVEFAKANAPQLMIKVYIDDEQGLAYSFQLFESSEAILQHWTVSDPNIAEVMKYCEVRAMDVYGDPSEAVRDGILQGVGAASVSFIPEFVGFYRPA